MSETELFKIGLLKIAEELHMAKTGASEALLESEEKEYLAYLQKRLWNWRGVDGRATYDECVRHLLFSVLQERGISMQGYRP